MVSRLPLCLLYIDRVVYVQSVARGPMLFDGYTMMSDGGGKTWKTFYTVVRSGAKTMDCFKEPAQTKLKESVRLDAGAMLYTFPPDSVRTFRSTALLPTRQLVSGRLSVDVSRAFGFSDV